MLATALIAAVALACSLSTPTVVVPMEVSWDDDFQVLVYDASGLVAGARDVNRSPYPFGESATARPEVSEIDLAWTGGACTHRPTLTVSGNANALHLEVHSPNDSPIPFLPMDCPLVGLPFGVTLELNQPVEQQAITAEFHR